MAKRPISKRRHGSLDADINITPVMNLFMVLIPFLLLTAVFAKTAVIDIYLPQASNDSAPSSPAEILSVSVAEDGFKFGGLGKQLAPIPRKNNAYDFVALSEKLLTLKEAHPDKNEVILLFPQNAPYELVIKAMDSTREIFVKDGEKMTGKPLFPLASVGELPRKAGE